MKRTFTGEPIDFDFRDVDLIQALREMAAYGSARVEVPEGVTGKVWLKLVGVPWDQALDLVVHTWGLTWTRTGDVIQVARRPRPPSR